MSRVLIGVLYIEDELKIRRPSLSVKAVKDGSLLVFLPFAIFDLKKNKKYGKIDLKARFSHRHRQKTLRAGFIKLKDVLSSCAFLFR